MDWRGWNKRLSHKINHSNTKWTSIIVHLNPPLLPNCHCPENPSELLQILNTTDKLWRAFFLCVLNYTTLSLPQYLWFKISNNTKHMQLINGVVQSSLITKAILKFPSKYKTKKRQPGQRVFLSCSGILARERDPFLKCIVYHKNQNQSQDKDNFLQFSLLFLITNLWSWPGIPRTTSFNNGRNKAYIFASACCTQTCYLGE